MYSIVTCRSVNILKENSFSKNELGFDLYKIDLLKYQEIIPHLINQLSYEERDRANAFHFSKDKNRFIVCRSILKILLAKYTNTKISELILEKNPDKKPFLASHPYVQFNLSHSDEYALIIISQTPVGVDIEYVNKQFKFKDVFESVFSQTECDEIINHQNPILRFYEFWTRKESIVKAIGKGIDENIVKIPANDGSHQIAYSIVNNIKHINALSFQINDDYIGTIALTEDIHINKIQFSYLPNPEELQLMIQRL